MVSWLRALVRNLEGPERATLLGVALLRVIGIGWGLPASDGWDVDGIAPRDFLPGLIETFTPGHYFTYPPFHLALLALLTLPVTVVTLLRAPSTAAADVLPAFLGTGTMTAFALVARATSLVMSLGVVLVVGRMSEAVFGTKRARVWAMAFAGTEAAATYYAHTTNLDLPMLFWGMLAILALIREIERSSKGSSSSTSAYPNYLQRAAVFAAFAIASKDQGYALFAIAIPIAVMIWVKVNGFSLWRRLAVAASTCVGLVLLFDGALFNPSGFAARLRFLTGPASQGFAQHAPSWEGRASAFGDTVLFLPNHYPLIAAPIFLLGIWVALRGKLGLSRLVSAMPLLVVISFTIAFNCVARRVEERFVMPQMQFLAVYAGVLGVVASRWARHAGGVALAWALRDAATVDANMLGDARYDAESFMRTHFSPPDGVETYGSNVYLPRFPAALDVHRVGVVKGKNPMPGITEEEGRLSEVQARAPRWVVVPQGFAWRYLQTDHEPDAAGRIVPAIQREHLSDSDTTNYLHSLFAEQAGYRLAARFHYAGSWLFPPRPLHASLATDVYIFKRSP